MQKIKVLPENLSNMIAAGEVVERPASVVKELVENSIDAGSSKIDVTVRDGGKRLIRVADNGVGMSREDALLSLERHATSKIETPDDLFSISTMGFRGEAMASIASISRMTISTKEGDNLEGTEIVTEGGAVKDVRAAGLPSGTIIEVKDLFYNTPARKKFLKTTTTEMGHISDYVARTALAFPAISFTLRTESASIFDLPAGNDLKDRIVALLGKEDTDQILEVDEAAGSLRLTGFISPPSIQRSTASALYLYVNGRYVKDRVVRHALMQGYESYIMRGKYPLAILFLEIDPAEVDVNVHPAKSEVKFRESGSVHSLVSASVGKVLGSRAWLRSESPAEQMAERIGRAAAEYVSRNEGLPLSGGYAAREVRPAYGHDQQRVSISEGANRPFLEEAVTEKGGVSGYFSSMEVIGQVAEMYILCQGEDGLVVIDQHAAYERIAFEELKAGYEGKSFKIQELLIPETLDLSPKEASALEEKIEEVRRLGFDLEHFGGRSFVVKAVPSLLGRMGVKEIITDIASDLADLPASRRFESILDDILKRVACHSVVRGRRRMTHEEMRDLLKRMDESGIVPHCPHGRPAHFNIPIAEIEKRFERI